MVSSCRMVVVGVSLCSSCLGCTLTDALAWMTSGSLVVPLLDSGIGRYNQIVVSSAVYKRKQKCLNENIINEEVTSFLHF